MTRQEKLDLYGHNTKFARYQENLKFDGVVVFSFEQPVARIEDDNLIQLGNFNASIQRHINFVAEELELTLIRPESE